MRQVENVRLGVVGLGYVGLPLAIEFGKYIQTVGFDINRTRVSDLKQGVDYTQETTSEEIRTAKLLTFTDQADGLGECDVFIVTVPTPVDEHKRPDFSPLIAASRLIGTVLKRGGLVIYESTVYPGATEEICVPELERSSSLSFNEDFAVGYSPERINPGDKERRLTSIPKITSGSNDAAAEFVDRLYKKIIAAGTHLAPSIKVAEAAKIIENTQRDVNIALMNEFSMIFRRLEIDTRDVLAAAGTKWNFLPFQPGLVGGHCIGVDPYYLIQKAQAVGYFPDILISCRRINDAMGRHVASEVVKLMISKERPVKNGRVLVLGFTFKENCPDLRNTRVVDLVAELKTYGAAVDIFDPWADRAEALSEYGLGLLPEEPKGMTYDAVIVAVGHDIFKDIGGSRIRAWTGQEGVIYDIKGMLARNEVDGRL